jgi:MutS domain V
VSASEEYKQRLADRQTRSAQLQNLQRRMGHVRLALVALALVLLWAAFNKSAVWIGWLAIPAVLFAAAVFYHHKVRQMLSRADRAAVFYRNGLARIEDRWAGLGQRGERFDDPHHIYASDLDLFGKSGLFELLSSARTRMGEETLASWLLAPASVETILARQACITELRARLDLREHLAVLGEDGAVAIHPDRLLQWAEAPNRFTARWMRWVSVILPALAIAAAALWSVASLAVPALLILLIETAITIALKKQIDQTLNGTENAFDDLKLLADLLERLEQERFESAPMQALMRKLTSHTLAASRVISRLSTITNLAESRRNIILAVLDVPLLYSLQVVLAAERWRREHGTVIRTWLATVGEMEALMSIAGYSHEHPQDPFPEFVDGAASLHGEELGHPLLPQAHCVRNSVQLGAATRVLLVSGSNMSGKSTLLRVVGINTVLAMAGAPVRAHAMRLTPLHVGASIRINDSLHEGSSRFYAEITRLRQLVDLQNRESRLLFLLDELLQGTNSRDRRIGAQGVLHAFVERGAIGLVSTHDLALTEISGLAAGQLRNVHFQDEIVNGRLQFDFKLRDGVVTKSNAIELMRSIGLNV